MRSLSRRTFLRGAGGVTIALPFLDEMRTRSLWAAPVDPPARAFNIFFDGGVPLPLQQAGLQGPLAPLLPFNDKMAFLRGIVGPDGHPASAGAAFVGKPPIDYTTAGGPSIDDEIMRHAYADRPPPTALGPQGMGFFYSFLDQPIRWIKSWRPQGTANAELIDTPIDLFTRFFGQPPGGPEPTRDDKVTTSILDGVLAQYRFYTSDRSNLSVSSRARLADHLDSIRALEDRVARLSLLGQRGGAAAAACAMPSSPAADLYAAPHHNGAAVGPPVVAADFVTSFKVMADLWTMAVKCDLFRSGFTLALCPGDHLICTGPYTVDGQVVDMAAAGDLHATNHAVGDNPTMGSPALLHAGWFVHLLLECCARVLEQMDAIVEPNGKTILDNSFVLLGTDLGTNHSGRSVFHGVSPAGGRFKTGIHDVEGSLLEFLDSCKAAMGLGGAPTPGMSSFIA
ncbi:MAG TPA: DUF1552 domain-containing protein [Polyangia bacterium]|nr:DUF1552 domain-containing protein [Polyangia bacterium]